MGGWAFGGKWVGRTARPTAESCVVLRADALARAGVFAEPSGTGTIRYRRTAADAATATATWWVERLAGDRTLFLRGGPEAPGWPPFDHGMDLTTTALAWGPRRTWFVCPGRGNAASCQRRVGCLYRLPGERRWTCRWCARLTYTSRLESCASRRLTRRVAGMMGVAPRGLLWLWRRTRVRGWGA